MFKRVATYKRRGIELDLNKSPGLFERDVEPGGSHYGKRLNRTKKNGNNFIGLKLLQ